MAEFGKIQGLQNKKFKVMNSVAGIKQTAEINVALEDLFKKADAQCIELERILKHQIKKNKNVL